MGGGRLENAEKPLAFFLSGITTYPNRGRISNVEMNSTHVELVVVL